MAEPEDSRDALVGKSIKNARKTLTDHYKYLRGNEARTRALVIDDVLLSLGWDVRNPALVQLEHRANGTKVDYVLMSTTGGFLAAVEAKAADSGPKDSDRRQASGYAIEIGARYAVLTNGRRWEAWEIVPQNADGTV